jgi:hypothetical protein
MLGTRKPHSAMQMRLTRACALVCTLLTASSAPVSAQYRFNPANKDEQTAGIRYFGSVKDENGVVISDATITIEADRVSFVIVTDELGRFHDTLALDMTANKVKVGCFKAGYKSIRLTKRAGVIGPRPTVQVDCVLQHAGKN